MQRESDIAKCCNVGGRQNKKKTYIPVPWSVRFYSSFPVKSSIDKVVHTLHHIRLWLLVFLSDGPKVALSHTENCDFSPPVAVPINSWGNSPMGPGVRSPTEGFDRSKACGLLADNNQQFLVLTSYTFAYRISHWTTIGVIITISANANYCKCTTRGIQISNRWILFWIVNFRYSGGVSCNRAYWGLLSWHILD